uniref:Uncharacterized protein n=1 Tax=Arundo donax TaxID=35708 RepID=A0A0A9ATP1_ARUDO
MTIPKMSCTTWMINLQTTSQLQKSLCPKQKTCKL